MDAGDWTVAILKWTMIISGAGIVIGKIILWRLK